MIDCERVHRCIASAHLLTVNIIRGMGWMGVMGFTCFFVQTRMRETRKRVIRSAVIIRFLPLMPPFTLIKHSIQGLVENMNINKFLKAAW